MNFTPQQIQYFQKLKSMQPQPMKTPALHIPSAADTAFAQQRQGVNEQYRTSIAGNNYERANTAASYNNRFRDLTDQYAKAREALPISYLRRGILGSGIYRQGLQDYAQQRLRATGDLQTQKSQQLGSFDLVRKQIESQRAQALAAIEAQRQMAMAQSAPGTIQ